MPASQLLRHTCVTLTLKYISRLVKQLMEQFVFNLCLNCEKKTSQKARKVNNGFCGKKLQHLARGSVNTALQTAHSKQNGCSYYKMYQL
jgi:hypothetical protein